jgi:hypothetical protein
MPRRLSLEDRIRALAKEDKATQNRKYNFKVHGKRLMVREGLLVVSLALELRCVAQAVTPVCGSFSCLFSDALPLLGIDLREKRAH